MYVYKVTQSIQHGRHWKRIEIGYIKFLIRFLILFRATIIGLSGSGKTTILYILRLGEFVNTIPTIGINDDLLRKLIFIKGFNVENVGPLTIWDFGNFLLFLFFLVFFV